MSQSTATLYAELRPLLFAIAYRMLGAVTEAEDVVQDSFVRFQHALQDGTVVEPATVKTVRTAVAGRARPWTNDELLALLPGGRGGGD